MAFRQVKFDGPDAQKLQNMQDSIQAALSPLEQSPVAGGQLVKATFSKADSDVSLQHGLGTASVGFYVTSPSAAGAVYVSPSPNLDAGHVLILRASAPMKCQIYVFPNG